MFDLLDHFGFRRFVKSAWYPLVFQVPLAIGFGVIIFYLFRGPQDYAQNPASILIWTFWWALLPFSFLLVGRLWCAVCPFAWFSDLVQKTFGRRKAPPLWLQKYSFWIVDLSFIFITWFDRVYGMTEHPLLTGLILLGLTGGVAMCALLYDRRVFCRYVCFLGNVAGNYSMAAPLELKAKDLEVCKNCKEKFCVLGRGKQPGCPFFQTLPYKDGNRFCTLCANCVKACPHDNIALVLRPFGSDFWRKTRVRFEESFFAKILVGVVIIQNIGMLSLWHTFSEFLENFTGIHNETLLFTLTYFGVISLPLLLMFVSSAFSAKAAKERLLDNFARFGYAFIAVDLAGHLAHNLTHLLGEGKTVLMAMLGLFTGEALAITDTALLSPESIKMLQYFILATGYFGTLSITYFISKKKAQSTREAILTLLPHALLLTLLIIFNFYIFSIPMMHRAH